MFKPLLFDKSIQKLEVLFKYSGLILKNIVQRPEDIMKYRCLYIFNFIWVFSASVVSVSILMFGILKGKSIVEATSIAPCLTFTILAMLKSIFHLVHEDDVQELTTVLRELEIKENNREECTDKENIISEETVFLSNVINVAYVLNILMILVFNITPFVLMAVKYYKTNEFEMMLPYLDVFLFIPYELKYWPFAYIHQIWAESIALLDMGAADYLFYTCCTHIRLQFRLLQHNIEKVIIYRDDIFNQKDDTSEDVRRKLVALILWHQELIKASSILEKIYSKSTLLNFLSSSFVICLTGFNVTIVKDVDVIITFVIFLFMGLMQIFFLCYFADILMSASVDVSNAVYNSLWFLTSTSIEKQLLVIQTRSQKPCKLTAAGFAEVNLRSFMKVLSTAWSYFALLQTMYSR